jgi:hypothetical protein
MTPAAFFDAANASLGFGRLSSLKSAASGSEIDALLEKGSAHD